MMRPARCWWCGEQAEVDTELPESGGMVKDTETSWLCADSHACSRRALAAWGRGESRNQEKPSDGERADAGLPARGPS